MTGTIKQDVQWYIADTGNMLSASFIILSFILIRSKTKTYQITLLAVFLVNIIDILHYWVCYKQNEMIIQVETLIMIQAAAQTILRKWRKG